MINIPNQNFKNVLNKENKNALGEYDSIDQTLDLSVGSLNTAVGEINTSFSFNNDNSAADVVNDVNTRGAEVGRVYDILKGLADIPTSLTSNTYSENIKANNTYYFTSTQDMLNLYQKSMNETSDIHINAKGADIKGELSFNDGKLELNNTGSTTFNITVEGYPDEVTENKNFTDIMNGFNGFSVPGNASRTKDINLASHVVTTQVFDNYGQAYNLDIRFEKSDSGETDGKLKWNWYASVEEPATITSVANGDIVFNGNGAYNSQSLKTITFTPNSGKNNIPVNVNLNFGNPGEFENIVSQNGVSATKSVEQNGYKKGELEDININSMGVINGIFSNGKTEQLAKLAVAMFANEEGLESIGSNTLKHSANSGEPIITSASNRGAGLVQSNAIERSNVDLSKELVNLIVQQRGLQANSKTLSTADSILETILNIKR
jgi:flagellar hook protein FlgE